MGFVTVLLVLFSCGAPVALGAGGLVDHPIASGSAPVYLDSEEWVASSPGFGDIRANVPGDLISDLQVAGLMGDPLYELNWRTNVSLWDAHVWTFSRSFDLSAEALDGINAGTSDTLLVFDGVKMSSTIAINGVSIGGTTNQFLRYTFSLASAVHEGVALHASGNVLSVSFDSALQTTEGRFMACSGGWVSEGGSTGMSLDSAAHYRGLDSPSLDSAARSHTLRPLPLRTGLLTQTPCRPVGAPLVPCRRALSRKAFGAVFTSRLWHPPPSRTLCRKCFTTGLSLPPPSLTLKTAASRLRFAYTFGRPQQ